MKNLKTSSLVGQEISNVIRSIIITYGALNVLCIYCRRVFVTS
jgi:hypothetical protein